MAQPTEPTPSKVDTAKALAIAAAKTVITTFNAEITKEIPTQLVRMLAILEVRLSDLASEETKAAPVTPTPQGGANP